MLIKEESRKTLRSWGQGADASNIKSKECPTFYPEKLGQCQQLMIVYGSKDVFKMFNVGALLILVRILQSCVQMF
jgi:hypothetical protein